MAYRNFELHPDAVRAWAKRMGFTYITAAAALGMGTSSYATMFAIELSGGRTRSAIGLRTAYACAAIEAGVAPIPATSQGLRDWMERMGFNWAQAQVALGIGRTALAGMLNPKRDGLKNPEKPDLSHRTALACAAIEAGLKPVKGPRIKS